MNLKQMQDCERTKIERLSNFQLSNPWKKRGIVLSIGIIVALITTKFIDNEPLWIKEVLKRLLLLSFLIISLSKEKQEDEMIASLRSKSYALAFIFAIGYTIWQPVLQYLIDNFVFERSPNNTFSYFEILFFMMLIQLMFFEVLKRNR